MKRLSKLVKFEPNLKTPNVSHEAAKHASGGSKVDNMASRREVPQTITVMEKPKSRLIELKIKQEAEAYQRRKEQYAKMHEDQNKAMSAFKIRKILMRKVSLKFGLKGQQEFLAKMIDQAIKDKNLADENTQQNEKDPKPDSQNQKSRSRSRSNRRSGILSKSL